MSERDSVLVRDALQQLSAYQNLTVDGMQAIILDIMQGGASDAQIAGFIVALRMKGETTEELEGAVRAMRQLMVPVELPSLLHTVDIVGTGGDGANLMNISTAASLVAAAAGAKVAKHGNRSVSSKSGSADLLETAGLKLDLNSIQVARCIETLGIGFMFATQHHTAMRFAAYPRRALGIRTIFNLLGPMTNPAQVKCHVIGTYEARWCLPMAEVLQRLGSTRALLVHSADGLDELSIAADNLVVELNGTHIQQYQLSPEKVGLTRQAIDCLKVANAQESLTLLKDALGKQHTPAGQVAAQMIAFNAGAALYAAGITQSIQLGVALAQDIISTGQALEKLSVLAEFTHLV